MKLLTYEQLIENQIDPIVYFNFIMSVANNATLNLKESLLTSLLESFLTNPQFIHAIEATLQQNKVLTPQ